MGRAVAGLVAFALCAALPAGAQEEPCAPTRAASFAAAQGAPDTAGDVRVYAVQYKQEIRHVESYGTFARKMRCLVVELVMPTADADSDGRADRPTIVVFNEDAGLATVATGSRGLPARTLATYGPKDPTNIPGALSAFASLAAGYAPAIAHYALAEPQTSPQRLILAATTDTFVRGFMKANSDLAREFGIYVVSSNNQAEFRSTTDPAAVASLADPDLAASYVDGTLTGVYEAVDVGDDAYGVGRAGIDVTNQAFMWAPVDPPADHPVQQRYAAVNGAPLSSDDPRRNVIHVNRKTPLTTIERDILDLSDDYDVSAANTGPFCLLPADDPGCAIKIGYGISLPAFMWGTDFGVPFAGDPCASRLTWMRCLDARGVNLFLQPEANPGRWADYIDTSWSPSAFQSLSWLDSAWRAVADPTVHNIRYAVTPHLVGNLVDLTFDGQSAIFERCVTDGAGSTCDGNAPATFVGAGDFLPCAPGQATRCDDPALEPYAGLLAEAIAIAPWVMPDAGRETLATRSNAMQAGTGSPHENDYLETAIWADLDFG